MLLKKLITNVTIKNKLLSLKKETVKTNSIPSSFVNPMIIGESREEREHIKIEKNDTKQKAVEVISPAFSRFELPK